MSWAGISDTTWVTNNNVIDALTNGIFSLKPGQNVAANNDWITAAEANAKLNINALSGTTRWPIKSEFVSSLSYPQLAFGYAVNGNNQDDAYTYENVCLFNYIQEGLYTTKTDGSNFAVGDLVLVFESGAYKPIYLSQNTDPNQSAITPNQVSWTYGGVRYAGKYDIESGNLLTVIDCSNQPGGPNIDNLISGNAELGGHTLSASSQFPVASDLQVSINWTDNFGIAQTNFITIPLGQSSADSIVSETILSYNGIGYVSPLSDSTYNYTL